MECKYLEPIIEIEPEFEPNNFGEAILVGEKEILIGEYCHKLKDYTDNDKCEKCKYKEELWAKNLKLQPTNKQRTT